MEWETLLDTLGDTQEEVDAKISRGEVFDTYLLDAQTYERRYFKFKITKAAKDLPAADKLWVKNFQGKVLPEPWGVTILEESKPQTITEISLSTFNMRQK